MLEMATVLGACLILVLVAYEYKNIIKNENIDNSRNYF